MPYIFPSPDGYGASIVYREDTLSEENKARGIKVDSIPQPENIPGKTLYYTDYILPSFCHCEEAFQ
jgi:hypothetical protein